MQQIEILVAMQGYIIHSLMAMMGMEISVLIDQVALLELLGRKQDSHLITHRYSLELRLYVLATGKL